MTKEKIQCLINKTRLLDIYNMTQPLYISKYIKKNIEMTM